MGTLIPLFSRAKALFVWDIAIHELKPVASNPIKHQPISSYILFSVFHLLRPPHGVVDICLPDLVGWLFYFVIINPTQKKL